MVQYIPDPTRRFAQRPYWREAELDRECETLIEAFLQRRRGRVEYPIGTEDLKILIEEEVRDLDQYADLGAYGSDVEGLTIFEPGRRPKVCVAAHLAEDSRRENRLRTTLAHEYGHVRFHGPLFERHPRAADLFDQPVAKPQVISCKREAMINAPKTDWMEWQAGHVSGALLMPVSAMRQALAPVHERLGSSGPVLQDSPAGRDLIQTVVARFQVSADAARVRLTRLNYLGTPLVAGSLFQAC